MDILSKYVNNKFLEWLNNCPYLWHLDSSDDNCLKYTFIIEKPEEDYDS
tara:strand:- start:2215 stop:2361 length:147 start_codon:yes stop_codon:yes gene_type:complete